MTATTRPNETPEVGAADAVLETALLRGGVDPFHVEQMITFHRVLENYRGCTTPIEGLISSLVTRYHRPISQGGAGGVTPEDVARDVAEFQENFEDIQTIANRFAREYPALMAEGATA